MDQRGPLKGLEGMFHNKFKNYDTTREKSTKKPRKEGATTTPGVGKINGGCFLLEKIALT
jgi:hypothetical protein